MGRHLLAALGHVLLGAQPIWSDRLRLSRTNVPASVDLALLRLGRTVSERQTLYQAGSQGREPVSDAARPESASTCLRIDSGGDSESCLSATGAQFLGVTEAQLQAAVDAALTRCGYLVYHTVISKRSQTGFPDVVAVRVAPGPGPLVVVLELKTERGKLNKRRRKTRKGKTLPSQLDWITAWQTFARIAGYGGTRVYAIVLRPSGFDILQTLIGDDGTTADLFGALDRLQEATDG